MPIKRRSEGEQLHGAEGQRQVFLDCGANVGQSLTAFHEGSTPTSDSIDFNDWVVVSFEPNPKLHLRLSTTQLKLLGERPRAEFQMIKAGCWWEDTELPFFEGVRSHEAGTFAEWRRKRAEPCKRWPNGSGPVVIDNGDSLPVIDFPAWVKDQLKPEDYIVMKVDIEGAEYKLIEAMMAAGVMDWIDVFYCEWSTQAMVPPVSRKTINALIHELESTYNISVRAWL